MAKRKNPAAVKLGRRGGKARVPKGFAVLSTEERSAIAKKAAAARWEKKGKLKPYDMATKLNRRDDDRSRINLHEDYEIRYWTKKFGCTVEQLKEAVQKVGVSARKVEEYIRPSRPYPPPSPKPKK